MNINTSAFFRHNKDEQECAINKITLLFCLPSIGSGWRQAESRYNIIQCTLFCFWFFLLASTFQPIQTNSNLFCLCVFEDVVVSGVFLFSYRRTWQITKSIWERHLPCIIHTSFVAKRTCAQNMKRKKQRFYSFPSIQCGIHANVLATWFIRTTLIFI